MRCLLLECRHKGFRVEGTQSETKERLIRALRWRAHYVLGEYLDMVEVCFVDILDQESHERNKKMTENSGREDREEDEDNRDYG
jgi:hypothetical protein